MTLFKHAPAPAPGPVDRVAPPRGADPRMVVDLSPVRPLGREDRRWLYVAALGWRDRYVAHIYAFQDGQH